MTMWYLIFKSLLSGIIVMAASEVAKRYPALGALIVSLPMVSLLAIVWLWMDTRDTQRIADHSEATFWYVLPTLPMFLALPMMLRSGLNFWFALAISCALTAALYLITIVIAARFGVRL